MDRTRACCYGVVGVLLVTSLAGSGTARANDVENFVKDPARTTGRTLKSGADTVGDVVDDVLGGALKASEGAVKGGLNLSEDAVRAVGKAHEEAFRKVRQEAGNGVENLGEALQSIGYFADRQLRAQRDALKDASRRVRQGRVTDALWHAAVDPLEAVERNAARAAQESSVLNTLGQVAANAYGGPGGAAAYAAWFTYRQTGDADLALRVGVITGTTSAAMVGVDSMDPGVKKTVLAGAIGGTAVAASGGNEAAIRDGFLLAGGMVVVRDEYRQLTTRGLDARHSQGDPYCMKADPRGGANCLAPAEAYQRDAAGNPIGEPDVRKVPHRAPHVGEWANAGEARWAQETGLPMQAVSKVPGMNAMALFHDQWMAVWKPSDLMNKATIAPAIVLTYVGTGEPLYRHLQASAVARVGAYEAGVTPATLPAEGTPAAVTSIACVQDPLFREIVLEEFEEPAPLACHVVYFSEKGAKVLWQAHNEPTYCAPHAAQFVAKQQNWGWDCRIR